MAVRMPSKGYLKGQYNEIFNLQFFSSFKPAGATDHWDWIFSFLVEISLRYKIFSVKKSGGRKSLWTVPLKYCVSP